MSDEQEDRPWMERSDVVRFFGVLGVIVASLITIAVVVVSLQLIGFGYFLPLGILVAMVYGWALTALIRHWQSRQEELLLVMTSTVEAKLPLPSALRAYLQDRPKGLYEIWIAILAHIVVFPLYYWVWHRHFGFDHCLGRLTRRLEDGDSLSESLQAWPYVATQETRIAVAIGEATGELALALRQGDQKSTLAEWIEILPRLLYPMMLMLVMSGITAYIMIQVMPRLLRIAFDFRMPLPAATEFLCRWWALTTQSTFLFLIVFIVCIPLAALFIASQSFRWYMPLLGRFYQSDMQGMILRSLGSLLSLGRTVPDAITQLIQFGNLPKVLDRCLQHTLIEVERGQPLANAMQSSGLLPGSMMPLVQVATRMQCLPLTLRELGEVRAGQAIRLARRLSMTVAPIAVMLVGLLACGLAIAVLMPLISMMETLSR